MRLHAVCDDAEEDSSPLDASPLDASGERTVRSGARELPRVLHRELAHGEVIANTYRIGGVLGRGGMGCVYEAEDILLGRQVAIKVAGDGHQASLATEARALAAVRHPGVVMVHGVGTHQNKPFIVMERLRGESLQRRLDVLKTRKERFSIEQTLDVLIAIASALAAVHRAGIAHRDLKPGNVVLAGDRVVLVDFGLFIPEFDIRKQTTVAGSGEFIAPEVIRRKVVPGKGPLIDLYALGIMAYELLCGRTPFVAPTFDEMLRRHLEDTPAPIVTLRPDVPPALAVLIGELLRKEPMERPGSAEEVVVRLTAMRSPIGALENVCPRRVLVLDPNPAVASRLRRALKLAMPQLAIETETDPRLGLEEIERTPPDVVIVNLEMPEMNGVEIAMAIGAMSPERRPRVIGMGARATAADISVMHRLGGEAFVVQNASLTARLVAVLGHLRWTG